MGAARIPFLSRISQSNVAHLRISLRKKGFSRMLISAISREPLSLRNSSGNRGIVSVCRRRNVSARSSNVSRTSTRCPVSKEEFYTEENRVQEHRKVHLSPSGRYNLTIDVYGTKPGCWSYTRGRVYQVEDGVLLGDVKRNYSSFPFEWV